MINQNEILDSSETLDHVSFESSLSWWEKKRIIFNTAIALSGVCSFLLMMPTFNLRVILEIITWVFLLNIFYCFGFLEK